MSRLRSRAAESGKKAIEVASGKMRTALTSGKVQDKSAIPLIASQQRPGAKSLIFSKNYSMPAAVISPHQPSARYAHRGWRAYVPYATCVAYVAGLLACAGFVLPQPALAQGTVIVPSVPNNDFQEATILYRAGKSDAAMERIDAWLKARPKDARGRFLRGMILTQQKKIDDAVKVYTELSQDYPELPEPYNNLAVIHADRGEFDKARGLLESAVRANAAFSAAHENLGDIHARLAAQSYENALKLDANSKTLSAKLRAVNEVIPARAPASAAPVVTPATPVSPGRPVFQLTPLLAPADKPPNP